MNKDEYKTYFARKKRWTESEKRLLLKGLKKYGSDNPKKLKLLLPNKTVSSIMQMIRKYEAIAELGKKAVNSPLDVWIRSGIFSGDNTMIPEALLFLSKFEDHPPAEETGGFDLKLAYQFLYEASSGHLTTNLPKETAELFKKLILTVDKEIWPSNECSTTDYLIGQLAKVESDKCYTRKCY